MANVKRWIIPTIIGLVFLFFLVRNCTPTIKETVVTIHDTIDVKHDSVVYRDTGSIKYITTIKTPIKDIPKKLIPSENPDTLVKQYAELLTEHSNKHLYLDTLKIDSIGWVAITDTIQYNKIAGRQYKYSVRERTITNTTTITKLQKPRNQFYMGVESGFSQSTFNNIQLGLLLKNRSDNIIKATGGYDFRFNGAVFSVGYYTKLHL